MNVCRTCLRARTEKDISELHIKKKTDSFEEIFLFCLNIKVTKDLKISTKLCLKCYRKILSFHKFKSQALRNEDYWQSLACDRTMLGSDIKTEDDVQSEGVINSDNETKDAEYTHCEMAIINNSDLVDDNLAELKNEFKVKVEYFQSAESDDELLSVIKHVRDVTALEETKENVIESPEVKRQYKMKTKRSNNNQNKDQICEECGKTVRNLKEHMYLHLPADSRKKLQCKMCEKQFSSHSARYKHYKIKHLGLKARCPECNKDVVNLRSHSLVVHKTELLPFQCVPCGRKFISRSLLEQHMTVHSKLRPFQCDECDKSYRSKIILAQHKRQVHDKEKSHLCQFCSKSFFKKYHLQEHLKTHSDDKPKFECSECGKNLSSLNSLRNHRLVHSGVKMFECTVCTIRFSKPAYLTKHMLTHTKLRKFSCKHCGWKFGRSDHCKRHEWTVHEKNLLATNIDT